MRSKQRGFALSGLLMVMVAALVVTALLRAEWARVKQLNHSAVLLNKQMQRLSTALSRHYLINCGVQSVSQADLVGRYIATEQRFEYGRGYALSIITEQGKPMSKVAITFTGEHTLLIGAAIANGAVLNGTTLSLIKPILRAKTAYQQVLLKNARLFSPMKCQST